MSRSAFQVLVIPFRKMDNEYKYCLFLREDSNVWQAVAGGGEENESLMCAANREFEEETGIITGSCIQLQSMCYMPSIAVRKEFLEDDIVVIPEYSFAVEVRNERIKLSSEHTRFEWLSYQEACNQLHWDSNKTALWELDYKLKNNLLHKEISC